MYHKYHTKGIVLGGRVDGDDSRRINLFTEDFGIISARVQGARNAHSKLRPGVQDLSMGEFSLVHGKSGWKVVSAKSQKNLFEAFRGSRRKLHVIGNVLNLVKRLVSEEEVQTSVFGTVESLVDFLQDSSESDVNLAECLILLRILHALGYMREDPELSIPIASSGISAGDLAIIAPRRSRVVSLINESLKATQS